MREDVNNNDLMDAMNRHGQMIGLQSMWGLVGASGSGSIGEGCYRQMAVSQQNDKLIAAAREYKETVNQKTYLEELKAELSEWLKF